MFFIISTPLEISRVFWREISLIRWITYIMSCFEDEKLSSFVFLSLHKKKTTILQCNLSQLSHIYMIKLTIKHEIKHFIHRFILYNSYIIHTNTHKYTQGHTIISLSRLSSLIYPTIVVATYVKSKLLFSMRVLCSLTTRLTN